MLLVQKDVGTSFPPHYTPASMTFILSHRPTRREFPCEGEHLSRATRNVGIRPVRTNLVLGFSLIPRTGCWLMSVGSQFLPNEHRLLTACFGTPLIGLLLTFNSEKSLQFGK